MLFSQFIRPLAVLAVLGLTACVETVQSGLPIGTQTRYRRVAVLADVSDRVISTYWPTAFSDPRPIEGRLGWDASAATAELVRQQLAPAGATVSIVRTSTGPLARRNDVTLVLQQTPLNILGQEYDPRRNFFTLGGGVIGITVVTGAERLRDVRYRPNFVLWIRRPATNRAAMGENACTVGLTGTLVNPRTGAAVARRSQVTGRSVIPGPLSARDWDSLPRVERARVLSHCRLALRSAVSRTLVNLNMVD